MCTTPRAVYFFYKTIGTAPDRALVIQWHRMQQLYYGYDVPEWEDLQADVEVVLYEGSNRILVQYDNLGLNPDTSFEGIVNGDGSVFLNPTRGMQNLTASGTAISYTPGETPGVTVANPFPGRTHAGAEYEYTLRVGNFETAGDVEFDLAVEGSVWPTTLSADSVTVAFGTAEEVTVTVEVPDDAKVGDTDAFTFTAASDAKDKTRSNTLTTAVTSDLRGVADISGIPVRLHKAGAAIYDEKLVLFGGYNDSDLTDVVRRYDPESDSWSTLDTLSDPERSIPVAVVGDVAYLLDFPSTYNVTTYDFSDNSWGTGSDCPDELEAFEHTAVTVWDGKIYAIGTYDDLNRAWVYHPSEDSWTALTDLPDGRSFHSAHAIGGKIYVIGGLSSIAGHYPTSDILVYDIAEDAWDTIDSADLLAARFYHGGFVRNGLIYAVGGYDVNYSYSSFIPVFDPATEEWSYFDGFSPVDSVFFSFGATETVAVAAGGDPSSSYTSGYQTWVFDLCDTPSPDFSANAVTVETGEPVTFTSNSPATAPCNYTAFAWDFGDGGTASTDNVDHAYNAPGTYTVTLAASHAWGESEVEKTDYITVTEASDDDADDDEDSDDDADDDTADDDGGATSGDDDDDDGGCCGC